MSGKIASLFGQSGMSAIDLASGASGKSRKCYHPRQFGVHSGIPTIICSEGGARAYARKTFVHPKNRRRP